MAVPKQRHTKSRRNKRRAHLYIEEPTLALCSKCGKSVLPHIACANCGSYKGREVIDVLKKLNKKERKEKEKELKAKEAADKKEGKKEGPLSMEELSKR
ncbi:MAG: 50S ribosomal protein L32 [Candidatus Nealsonbacteria bacterium]|nr:50S ribosomal protein L32 [Candidatus Nealsonbacteria bacterium]